MSLDTGTVPRKPKPLSGSSTVVLPPLLNPQTHRSSTDSTDPIELSVGTHTTGPSSRTDTPPPTVSANPGPKRR